VRFNVWIVVLLATLPVLVMFVGMSAASAFHGRVEWEVLAWIVAGVAAVGRLATRAGRSAGA